LYQSTFVVLVIFLSSKKNGVFAASPDSAPLKCRFIALIVFLIVVRGTLPSSWLDP
jgi:hypothetical protein